MTDKVQPRSWWQTLPGTLTALAGLITALATFLGVLYQTGLVGAEDPPAPGPAISPSKPAGRTPAAPAVAESPTRAPVAAAAAPAASPTPAPAADTTDGWSIIGFVERGTYSGMQIDTGGRPPAIGRHYAALERFRLVQKRRDQNAGQVVTLGMVYRGDRVEILDLYVPAPSTQRQPVWAQLRATLHDI